MKEQLNWIITYMTDNGLTDEEVQKFIHTKQKRLENQTVMDYLRNGQSVQDFIEEYMLGL